MRKSEQIKISLNVKKKLKYVCSQNIFWLVDRRHPACRPATSGLLTGDIRIVERSHPACRTIIFTFPIDETPAAYSCFRAVSAAAALSAVQENNTFFSSISILKTLHV
jgi:hypothetical protein